MATINTVHALRIKYDDKSRTYSGELRITTEPARQKSWLQRRRFEQNEIWSDGTGKVIKHNYDERITETLAKRGTRAWKEKRKNKLNT